MRSQLVTGRRAAIRSFPRRLLGSGGNLAVRVFSSLSYGGHGDTVLSEKSIRPDSHCKRRMFTAMLKKPRTGMTGLIPGLFWARNRGP